MSSCNAIRQQHGGKTYVDDVFLIWTHGQISLETFMDTINTQHPSIKFSATWSRKTCHLPRHLSLPQHG